MERGYVKLWRKTLDSGLLQHPTAWQLFGWLLLTASRKPRKQMVGGVMFDLQPGDAIFGRVRVAAELGMTEKQARCALDTLKKLSVVAARGANKCTIVSIINWHRYQDEDTCQGPADGPTGGPAEGPSQGQVRATRQECENIKNQDISKNIILKNRVLTASDSAKPAPADAGAAHSPESASDSAPQQACKPMSRKARTAAKAAESTEPFLLTKKGRKLTGKRLAAFEAFWEAYALKKGKVEAADAWLDIPSLTDGLVARICDAARQEAQARQLIEAKGGTPKWAQGWISGRRWEDYEPSKPPPARFSASEHGLTEAERQKALETMHRLELARKQKACHYQTEKTAKNREQRT